MTETAIRSLAELEAEHFRGDRVPGLEIILSSITKSTAPHAAGCQPGSGMWLNVGLSRHCSLTDSAQSLL